MKLAATLEAASRLLGEPIYIVIDRAERLEHSDLTYALERMTRLQASRSLKVLKFWCA